MLTMPASTPKKGRSSLREDSFITLLQNKDIEKVKKLLVLLDDRPILLALKVKLIDIIKSAS